MFTAKGISASKGPGPAARAASEQRLGHAGETRTCPCWGVWISASSAPLPLKSYHVNRKNSSFGKALHIKLGVVLVWFFRVFYVSSICITPWTSPVLCSLLLLGLVTQVRLCKIRCYLALHRDTLADQLFKASYLGWVMTVRFRKIC